MLSTEGKGSVMKVSEKKKLSAGLICYLATATLLAVPNGPWYAQLFMILSCLFVLPRAMSSLLS